MKRRDVFCCFWARRCARPLSYFVSGTDNRRRLTWLIEVGLVLILVALVLGVCIPNFAGSHRSKTLEIISNLRQLDGAMQQWALDDGTTGAVVATQEDIVAYLRHPLKPVAGERYILRGLSESPEAQLTREVEGHPGGSLLRLSTNGGFDVILPNEQGGANRRQKDRE